MGLPITSATSSDERRRAARVAVLPVGSCEQHGAHLPLITDTVIACLVAQRIADEHEVLLLPPVTISCSHEHAGMAGTVSIRATTLYATLSDIRASLRGQGVPALLIVNGHGGNYVLANFTQEANTEGACVALFPSSEDRAEARADAELASASAEDMHGGEFEVSILLHGAPQYVRDAVAGDDHSVPARPHLLILGMAGYTENGIIGQPSLATAAKGKALLDSLARTAARHLALLQGA